MDQDKIAELRRLCEAASGGEWRVDGHRVVRWTDMGIEPDVVAVCEVHCDADYIAAARPEQVFALLDEIERLQGQHTADLAERDAELKVLREHAAQLRSVRREEIERLVSGNQGKERSSSVVAMLAGMTRDTVDELEAAVEAKDAEIARLQSEAEAAKGQHRADVAGLEAELNVLRQFADSARGIRDAIADDSIACTYQTMGQYRTSLLRLFDGAVKLPQGYPAS